jgi:lipase chaperone LimK
MTALKNRIVAVLGVAAVLAALGWWSSPSQHAESTVVAESTAAGKVATGAGDRAPPPVIPGGNNQVVEIDVMGSRLDASRLFDLGFAGGLNIDQQTRSALDTLLVAMSDTPDAKEIDKLEWTLRNGLPKADAEKAIKMFHGYRAYLGDMQGEMLQLGIPDTPAAAEAYFDQVALVQRRHFDDATAAALFSQENQSARLVMQAALIAQNEALSASEKKDQLDKLRAQLPPERRDIIPAAEAAKP